MSDGEDKQRKIQNAIEAMREKYCGKDKDAESVPENIKPTMQSFAKLIEEELNKDRDKFHQMAKRKQLVENFNKMKMIKVMNNFLTQYLDGYILIGIDTTGQDLVISQYSSPKDYRAVSHLLSDFISGELGGMRNINGMSDHEDDPFEDFE